MINEILQFGKALIDKIFPDKTKATEAKAELVKQALQGNLKELEYVYNEITAEVQSKDKWTSRAHPTFMYVIYLIILAVFPFSILYAINPIIANNVITGAKMWFDAIPTGLYQLFGVGYVGYTGFDAFKNRKKR